MMVPPSVRAFQYGLMASMVSIQRTSLVCSIAPWTRPSMVRMANMITKPKIWVQ